MKRGGRSQQRHCQLLSPLKAAAGCNFSANTNSKALLRCQGEAPGRRVLPCLRRARLTLWGWLGPSHPHSWFIDL